MILKEGVDLNGLRPMTLRALAVADEVHQQIFGEDIVITDGIAEREDISLHPFGLAFDARSKGHDEKLGRVFMTLVRDRCIEELGVVVQIIRHGPVDHYHTEVDPT